MKKHIASLATLGLIAIIFSMSITAPTVRASENKGIALTLKVNGDVKFKKAGTTNTVPLKFGTVLDDGDWIRTGDDGFVIMIFTDDKSQIKLNARTEITIQGKRDAKSNITKRISLEVGQLLAKVQEQKGTLQIATPTSVASVRGTEFWVVVIRDPNDPTKTITQLITLEGLVELLNTQSGQIVDVRPGETGESDANGSVHSGQTSDGGVPHDPDPGFTPPHNIEVEVQNQDGTTHRIIIEYQEGTH